MSGPCALVQHPHYAFDTKFIAFNLITPHNEDDEENSQNLAKRIRARWILTHLIPRQIFFRSDSTDFMERKDFSATFHEGGHD